MCLKYSINNIYNATYSFEWVIYSSFSLSQITFEFISLGIKVLFLLHYFFRIGPKLELLIQSYEHLFLTLYM